LVSEDLVYQNWIIKRNNAGITIKENDLSNMKEVIAAFDYQTLVSNLIKSREAISLKAHIPRLIEFYTFVANRNERSNMSDEYG
jgi:hypothetical protein